MTNGESFDDQLERVRCMIADDGATWDLSEKDKAAVASLLKAYEQLREAMFALCRDVIDAAALAPKEQAK